LRKEKGKNNNPFVFVPHIGILSNQFIEDLDLIYKLKTILKLNKPFKINL